MKISSHVFITFMITLFYTFLKHINKYHIHLISCISYIPKSYPLVTPRCVPGLTQFHWLHMLCTRTLYSIRWLHILSTRTSLIPLATPCYVPGLIILQAILFTTGYIKYHSSDPITVEMYVSRMMYQIKLKRFYKH